MCIYKEKNEKTNIIALTTLLLLATTINVSADILKKYTNFTYVESTHPNIWEYKGFVSVKGSDWIRIDPNNWGYPSFSRITYKVPKFLGGTISGYNEHPKTVYSYGKGDNVQRKDSIVVKDSLNPINGKTKALWNIQLINRGVGPGDPEPMSVETEVQSLK